MFRFSFSKRQFPIGIDISDHSIEVLELGADREVLAYGRVILPKGAVKDGRIIKKEIVLKALRDVLRGTKPRPLLPRRKPLEAILMLPESKVFVHLFSIKPEVKESDIEEEIAQRAARVIPVDHERIYWDYRQIMTKNDGSRVMLYVGTMRDLVREYIDMLMVLGIRPVAFDVETIALSRSLVNRKDGPTMVLDIGARTTTVGIFDSNGVLNLSISIPIAGDSFNDAIMERLSVDVQVAERMKRDLGFDRRVKENRALIILQQRVQLILHELHEAMEYFEDTRGEKVTNVVLAGGSSQIPYLDEYLKVNLQIPVRVGNPLKRVNAAHLAKDKRFTPVLFANVAGAALRGTLRHPERADINLLGQWDKEEENHKEVRFHRKGIFLVIPYLLLTFGILGFVIYKYIYTPQVLDADQRDRNRTVVPVGNGTSKQKDANGSVPNDTAMSSEDVHATSTEPTGDIIPVDSEDLFALGVVRIQDTPTGWLNVRSGPGQEYSAVVKAYPDEEFPYLAEEKEWIQIDLGADSAGWVSLEYVQVEKKEGEGSIDTTEGASGGDTVDTDSVSAPNLVRILDTPTGYLNVRESPSTSGTLLTRVYPGESYPRTGVDEGGKWYKIRLVDKSEGWVFAEYASVSGE